MANRLIIYSSTGTGAQILAAHIARLKYPDATIKDITGIATGDIDTYIGTLTDDYYTDILITATSQLATATGVISFDQVAGLRAKMITASKGTTVRANSCQANAVVTEIILDAGASAVNDYYNGMFIVTAGVTAVYRYIKDYVGATTTVTTNTTTVAVTNTETFIVYTNTNIHELGNTSAVNGKTAATQTWDLLYTGITYPLAVAYLGGYLNVLASGTAAGVAAATITFEANVNVGDGATDAQHDTDDFYNGMFVYIYSGTGAYQVREITDYNGTTHVATVAAWTTQPAGAVYRVVRYNDERVYADRAMDIYTRTNWKDLTDATGNREVERVLNLYGELDSLDSGEAVSQDEDLLWNDILYRAKFAFKADALGIV